MIKELLVRVYAHLRTGAKHAIAWLADRPALLFIVLIAFLLRVATLLWGLPNGPDDGLHPDEYKYLQPAIRFLDHYLTSRPFPLYGTSLQYTIGPLLAPFDLATYLTGHTPTYLVIASAVARLVVALLGTAAVALTYRLAEQVADSKTALIAAVFLAVAPFHVLNSSWFTLDVPMATLLLINMLLVLQLARQERPALYAWWGVAFGYMLGMKLTAAVFLAFPFVLALSGEWRFQPARWRGLALFGGVSLATFAVLNPQFFFAFDAFIDLVALDKVDFWDRTASDTALGAAVMHWSGYVRSVGWPLLLAAIGGMAIGLKRMPKFTWACLAFLLVYGLFFRHRMLGRYVIFVTPVLCLYAGLLCATLMRHSTALARTAAAAAAVAVAALTAYAAGSGIVGRWFDPRIQAARFVAAHYPSGTRVALAVDSEEYPDAHKWHFPTLHNDDHVRVTVLEDPAVIVTSSGVMTDIVNALESEFLAADYSWDAAENRWWYRNSPPSPALFRFYERFVEGADYELVKTFELPVDYRYASEFMVREVRVYARLMRPE